MKYGELFSMTGKNVLVLGGANGIGACAVHALAAYGARVYCGDVDLPGAQETCSRVESSGGHAEPLRVDVRRAEDLEAALGVCGPPDALILTPAMNVRRRLSEIGDADVQSVLELNLMVAVRVLRLFGKAMAERKRGSMIFFSSVRSVLVEPGQAAYACSKAALVQLVKVAAAELGPSSVRVNAIAPGVVETQFTRPIRERADWHRAYAAKTALGRWAQPQELAGAVVFLASDASTYVTGTQLFVDGGWTAIDGRFEPPV